MDSHPEARAPAARPGAPAAPAPTSWRRTVLPVEHGGWAFLGEPILLGLLVAWSWSGVLLAGAALAAFLSRQPLEHWVSDRRRGKRYPRTVVAERAFALCALLGAGLLAGAIATARGPLLKPLGLAAPLAALSLAATLARRAGAAAAELSGALALGALAPALALAAGRPAPVAFALWGVLAARAVSSVPYVRARLRLERGETPSRLGVLAAQAAALGLAIGLAALHLGRGFAVGAIGLLALRAALGISPARTPVTPARLGASEVAAGLIVVAAAWADAALRH